MSKIILIGGSPTAGKSYTARRLAEQLKLPWISTDTIREQMRKIVRKEDYPALFLHSNYTSKLAVEFLSHNTAEEIVKHQNKESIAVWKGVKALIETDYVWKSFIIEGVAILPSLVSGLIKRNKNIQVVFLIDEDIDRVRKTIFTRGLWDDASKYPDEVKEAKKYRLPVVSIGDRKDYINKVKRLIKN